MSRFTSLAACCVLLAAPALADIDVGSDGSDGALDLTGQSGTVMIDLALAADASWDTPSPVSGKGVYDAEQWAVVFKYTTVIIPAGVTVTFMNHPSRAPAVWLCQDTVTIAGSINIGGATGHSSIQTRLLSEPGPGGFRGGRASDLGSGGTSGQGPGGAAVGDSSSPGSGGSYGTSGAGAGCGGGAPGPIYGNAAILPLVGGSGGSGAQRSDDAGGGGAGGGAILIATNTTLALTGLISAQGGNGGPENDGGTPNTCNFELNLLGDGGGGSGGAIRLVGNSIIGNGTLRAVGGIGPQIGGEGGHGRIRVEANDLSLVDPGDPPYVQDLPTFIFPPPGAPVLRVIAVAAQPVPDDPHAVLDDPFATDVSVDSCDSQELQIEAENLSTNATVEARVVALSGATSVVPASFVTGDCALSTWAADVAFQPGYSAVQVRAFFDPTPCGLSAALGSGKSDRPLRTLDAERIEKVETIGTRTIYITETGRRIPVDAR